MTKIQIHIPSDTAARLEKAKETFAQLQVAIQRFQALGQTITQLQKQLNAELASLFHHAIKKQEALQSRRAEVKLSTEEQENRE